MSVSRVQIVADAPMRGRPTADDIEARSGTGRALHWLETRVMDLAMNCSRFFLAHERETLIDADCDDRVEQAILALDTGNGIEARALLLEFRERDALRDAEHHAQHGHVVGLHAVTRRIGAFIERSCVALRSQR